MTYKEKLYLYELKKREIEYTSRSREEYERRMAELRKELKI